TTRGFWILSLVAPPIKHHKGRFVASFVQPAKSSNVYMEIWSLRLGKPLKIWADLSSCIYCTVKLAVIGFTLEGRRIFVLRWLAAQLWQGQSPPSLRLRRERRLEPRGLSKADALAPAFELRFEPSASRPTGRTIFSSPSAARFSVEILEPTGFEPVTSSMPLRRSTN